MPMVGHVPQEPHVRTEHVCNLLVTTQGVMIQFLATKSCTVTTTNVESTGNTLSRVTHTILVKQVSFVLGKLVFFLRQKGSK